MIGRKLFIYSLTFCFLSACTTPTAMLGPAYTLSTSGSILQAGISYGSSEMVTMYTGKTPLENFKEITLEDFKNVQKNTLESKDFHNLVKNRIYKTNKLLNLSNQ